MTLTGISQYMDQPTKKMIETLIKRKRKYEAFARQCKRWQWTALLSLAILIFYLVISANVHGQLQPEGMIATLLGNELFLFWIMAEVFAFYASYFYKKKEEKAEDEYHKLRCEIIQKSTDLWPQSDTWKDREAVFRFMQTNYDINLYFESK
ncbi:YpbF family protein [Bacillus sp. NPDC077027]|uniref:YpbF family protein n=1 Tax=Bacillus sp. NPDC077027 TaxID=3390548 RepID=UPI003D06273E